MRYFYVGLGRVLQKIPVLPRLPRFFLWRLDMSSKNVHLPNVPEAVSDPTNMIFDHHLSKQASTIGPRTQMPVCSLCLKSELRLDIAAAVIRQVKEEARIHAVLLGEGQVQKPW